MADRWPVQRQFVLHTVGRDRGGNPSIEFEPVDPGNAFHLQHDRQACFSVWVVESTDEPQSSGAIGLPSNW